MPLPVEHSYKYHKYGYLVLKRASPCRAVNPLIQRPSTAISGLLSEQWSSLVLSGRLAGRELAGIASTRYFRPVCLFC